MAHCYVESTDGLRKPKACCTRCFFVFIGISIIVACLLATVTAILYFNRTKDFKDPYCLPCASIGSIPAGNQKSMEILRRLLIKTKANNEKMCCVTTNSQAQDLLSLLAERNSENSEKNMIAHSPIAMGLKGVQDNYKNRLAFAQKSLCHGYKNTRINNVPIIKEGELVMLSINPDYTDPSYETTRGVELTYHGIKIIDPGFYFVYTSIYYFPDSNKPCKDFSQQVFVSNIVRNSTTLNRRTVIVTKQHTCCPDCIHDGETDFSGGVFALERGDIIQVEVTAVGVIHIRRDVTFVGLMMMEL